MNDQEYALSVATLQVKQAELKKLLDKGDEASIAAAATLNDELVALENDQDKFRENARKLVALKAAAAGRDGYLKDPVRTLPLPGGAGPQNDAALYKRSSGTSTEIPGVEVKKDARGRVASIEYVDRKIDPMEIFGSKGCFWYDCKEIYANTPPAATRERISAWDVLQQKSPSGLFEGSDPEGGIFVLPELSNEIYRRMMDEDNFMDDADVTVVKGNTLILNALDDSSRADGSRYGGVTSYWAAEANNFANASKPNFRKMDLRLHKLYVLTYMTEELFTDSPYALDQEVSKSAALELKFRTNSAMFAGNGNGQPVGIVKSTGRYAVAIEAGQTLAGSPIQTENVEKMWQHLHPSCRKDAVWLINLDVEEPLQLMNLPVGTGGSLLYQPVGGVSNPSYATLKGRPVMTTEFNEALGTEGDIVLTSWKHYKMITKGTVASNMSMHVRFLFDELAYKFTYRVDGQPKWEKPLAPYKGSTTTSSIVTLAARS